MFNFYMASLAKLDKKVTSKKIIVFALHKLMSHFNQRDLQIYAEKSNEMNESSISYQNNGC